MTGADLGHVRTTQRKQLLDLVKLFGEKGRLPNVGFGAANLYESDRLAIVRAKDVCGQCEGCCGIRQGTMLLSKKLYNGMSKKLYHGI